MHPSGASCREKERVCLRTRHTLNRRRPRRRAIQYSEEPVIEPKEHGVLDTRMRGV